jgi:diacylglycerol kinase family enzyme
MEQAVDRAQVVITANPFSGSRPNGPIVAALSAELSRLGIASQVMWRADELATAVAQGQAAGWRCIVAAGGDGTVSRVVNCGAEVPLAVLPLGTENLFARQFGFDRDVAKLARRIAAGQVMAIDVGQADEKRFTIVASAGFDGDVAHRLAQWRIRGSELRRVHRWSYVPHIVSSALHYPYPMIEVAADGKAVGAGSLVMVFNLPQYGFNFPLMPGARGDDGLLDYLIFERPGSWRLMGYTLSLVLRRHLRRGDVRHGRCETLEMRTSERGGVGGPAPVEIDGEAAGLTPSRIKVMAGGLTVVV